mmetsp:Transcript_125503/g.198902  ORF Transcript_125503/g.198902 Transcript_125503/m.198902 type:complete len:138 (-) Transcript_125503:68-481(-)
MPSSPESDLDLQVTSLPKLGSSVFINEGCVNSTSEWQRSEGGTDCRTDSGEARRWREGECRRFGVSRSMDAVLSPARGLTTAFSAAPRDSGAKQVAAETTLEADSLPLAPCTSVEGNGVIADGPGDVCVFESKWAEK